MKILKTIFTIICSAMLLCSCEDFFEKTPDGMLAGDDNFTERSNIYASFMGLLGTLQDAMDDLIVLSELKGELVMPTDQAPDSYWQIYRNMSSSDNPVADPAPLYRIVMNCNDYLRNTVAYNKKYPEVIPINTYLQLIAGTVTLRAWAYLQIGKLYGSAVYYDYAFTGEVDLTQLPVLSLDELIPELIYFMNNGVDGIGGNRRVNIDTMFGVDGTVWRRLAIAPDALMCELYLWDRNYEAAAKKGINLITGQGLLDAGNNHNLTCSYQFGSASNGLKQWYTLWSETPVNVHTNEGLTMVLFNYAQRQTNRLHELFSAAPPNLYYLKPTASLTTKYSGQDYRTSTSVVTDPRGNGVTFGSELGETVIVKYHKDRASYLQEAPIYIYRAADVHLMIAEALNALGNFDAAEKILNEGFSSSYVVGNSYNAPFEAPIYSFAKLSGGKGVRGRLDIPAVLPTDARFMSGYTEGTPEYNERRRHVLDSLIVEETSRELACEGKSWFTLLRIGRNLEKPDMVASMVCRKFPRGAEREAYRQSMLDTRNWFFEYDLKLDKQ